MVRTDWGPIATAMTDLGSWRLGKHSWEVALGKNPLGKYLTSDQMLCGGESS